jgi:DNA-binding MarR family transcriptional regulator
MRISLKCPSHRIPERNGTRLRDVCEARERVGLQDRALAVLDALLTFYPETELDAEQGLVVFPSNGQLSVRAHGITGTTLRRQLAALVEAGLIQRRDSPNGNNLSAVFFRGFVSIHSELAELTA